MPCCDAKVIGTVRDLAGHGVAGAPISYREIRPSLYIGPVSDKSIGITETSCNKETSKHLETGHVRYYRNSQPRLDSHYSSDELA
jgi:hypothetical protein